MFGKTSLAKILFVISILGALALVAVAPSVARAFFPQGLNGFASRVFNVQSEAAEVQAVVAESVSVVSGSATDGSAVKTANDNQPDDSSLPDYFEFVGTLTAKGDDGIWIVDGVSVHVSATTELKGVLDVGVLVKVEGTKQEDGSVLAREIKPALFDDSDGSSDDTGNSDGNGDDSQPALGNEIEFVGKLTEQTDTVWMVNGISVILTATTEIYGSPVVDDLVKVEGTLQDDGSVLAREIKPALFEDSGNSSDDNGDDNSGNSGNGTQSAAGSRIEFVGTLTAQSANVWTVSGISVFLSDTIEIYGSPVIGDQVKVEGTLQDDGSVLAREIKPALFDVDDDDDSDDDGFSDDDDDMDDDSHDGSTSDDDDDTGIGDDSDRGDDDGNSGSDSHDDDDSNDDHGNDDDSDDDHGSDDDSDDGDDDNEGRGFFFNLLKSLI